MGEGDFRFSCLGSSSLSRILEVFASNCLFLCDGDGISLSNFGLEVKVGECVPPNSATMTCSHSSVLLDLAIFSPILTSPPGLSSPAMFMSTACSDPAASTDEFNLDSDASFISGSMALEQQTT